MNLYLIGLLIFPGWLLASSHDAPQPQLELGKEIYLKRCKVCHGIEGDGKSFAANALNPPPKNFTSAQSKKRTHLGTDDRIRHQWPPRNRHDAVEGQSIQRRNPRGGSLYSQGVDGGEDGPLNLIYLRSLNFKRKGF